VRKLERAETGVDLNYLFHRQQVERSRAEAAKNDAARKAHEELAERYEEEIDQRTGDEFGFPRDERSEATD
jgi:hypothetical protein